MAAEKKEGQEREGQPVSVFVWKISYRIVQRSKSSQFILWLRTLLHRLVEFAHFYGLIITMAIE
ncbi:hypothetical protein ANCCAN_06934 [Ancylostoma caninum]|uniref:Uncharacterized protein n=1 Tax=Ancylostoma caninum TaxID=29170 RepID=A0A368GRL8_ANCCA|nr:hypothetical protein ANCCAN_06934 [Ancylostoma caninum]